MSLASIIVYETKRSEKLSVMVNNQDFVSECGEMNSKKAQGEELTKILLISASSFGALELSSD